VSATGEFDSMASQVGQIADVMAAFGPRHMQVNAVGGEGEHTNGTKKESSHTVETDRQAAIRPRREQVNAVGGAGEHTNGTEKNLSHTVETSDAEWACGRIKPCGSGENPLRFIPNDSEYIRP
jgi:hypothetical protein